MKDKYYYRFAVLQEFSRVREGLSFSEVQKLVGYPTMTNTVLRELETEHLIKKEPPRAKGRYFITDLGRFEVEKMIEIGSIQPCDLYESVVRSFNKRIPLNDLTDNESHKDYFLAWNSKTNEVKLFLKLTTREVEYMGLKPVKMEDGRIRIEKKDLQSYLRYYHQTHPEKIRRRILNENELKTALLDFEKEYPSKNITYNPSFHIRHGIPEASIDYLPLMFHVWKNTEIPYDGIPKIKSSIGLALTPHLGAELDAELDFNKLRQLILYVVHNYPNLEIRRYLGLMIEALHIGKVEIKDNEMTLDFERIVIHCSHRDQMICGKDGRKCRYEGNRQEIHCPHLKDEIDKVASELGIQSLAS